MPRSGTTQFTDAADYQASVPGAKFNLVFNCQKDFEARLTWVELRHLRLLRGQENLPRVALVSLMSEWVFVTVPTRHDPPPISAGEEVQSGDIVFHSLGERVHQRTRGPSQWGFISLTPEHLAACSRALTGLDLVSPPVARILRPPRLDAARLLRLHSEACRLAETKPEMIAHREVARAIEQDLIHTLVNCLTGNNAHNDSARKQHCANIIARFEERLGGALRAASTNTGNLRRHRRAGTDLGNMLRGSSRHGSWPISSVATTEHGAGGAAASESRNNKCCGRCPTIRILGVRALCRKLSDDVR